jgi:hypothetical protein
LLSRMLRTRGIVGNSILGRRRGGFGVLMGLSRRLLGVRGRGCGCRGVRLWSGRGRSEVAVLVDRWLWFLLPNGVGVMGSWIGPSSRWSVLIGCNLVTVSFDESGKVSLHVYQCLLVERRNATTLLEYLSLRYNIFVSVRSPKAVRCDSMNVCVVDQSAVVGKTALSMQTLWQPKKERPIGYDSMRR